eukprot:g3246.t1
MRHRRVQNSRRRLFSTAKTIGLSNKEKQALASSMLSDNRSAKVLEQLCKKKSERKKENKQQLLRLAWKKDYLNLRREENACQKDLLGKVDKINAWLVKEKKSGEKTFVVGETLTQAIVPETMNEEYSSLVVFRRLCKYINQSIRLPDKNFEELSVLYEALHDGISTNEKVLMKISETIKSLEKECLALRYSLKSKLKYDDVESIFKKALRELRRFKNFGNARQDVQDMFVDKMAVARDECIVRLISLGKERRAMPMKTILYNMNQQVKAQAKAKAQAQAKEDGSENESNNNNDRAAEITKDTFDKVSSIMKIAKLSARPLTIENLAKHFPKHNIEQVEELMNLCEKQRTQAVRKTDIIGAFERSIAEILKEAKKAIDLHVKWLEMEEKKQGDIAKQSLRCKMLSNKLRKLAEEKKLKDEIMIAKQKKIDEIRERVEKEEREKEKRRRQQEQLAINEFKKNKENNLARQMELAKEEERLNLLKRKEERVYEKERMSYRQQLYEHRIDDIRRKKEVALEKEKKVQEELEKTKQSLPYAKAVEEIDCNTERLNQKTKCFATTVLQGITARAVNQQRERGTHDMPLNGYSAEKVCQDFRWQLIEALRAVNLHKSNYAHDVVQQHCYKNPKMSKLHLTSENGIRF